MKKIIILVILLFLTGCNNEKDLKHAGDSKEINNIKPVSEEVVTPQRENYVNTEGMTVQDRYLPPKGFTRVEVQKDSFGEFLEIKN